MKQKVVVFESEWENSMYRTREWESSVTIKKWEHDYVEKKYIIDFEIQE